MPHITGQGKPTQEVSQIVSQGEQLKSRVVVFERAAGELRPFDSVLAFFDPLLDLPITILPLSQLLTGFNQQSSRR